MTDFSLVPHPTTPSGSVTSVTASIERTERSLRLLYIVEVPTDRLLLSGLAKPHRTDALWRTTCFELFLTTGPEAYLEFNFSTSSQWAEYRFTGYRAGMENLAVEKPPAITVRDEGHALFVSVYLEWLAGSPPAPDAAVGLSAVIEERDGTKSYWALAHTPGPPDFHNRDCFIATLPAPERP